MRAFADALPPEWQTSDVTVDTRLKFVKPGYVPLGWLWHSDEVGLTESFEPDLTKVARKDPDVVLCSVGPLCPTLFVEGEVELPLYDPAQRTSWLHHEIVEQLIRRGRVRVRPVEPDRKRRSALGCSSASTYCVTGADGVVVGSLTRRFLS